MSKFWNERVKKLEPYVPGEQPKDQKYIKLNTNENPYPPSPKVIEAIKAAANFKLKLYPDPNCDSLRRVVADYYNISEDEVFVGNGSDEVLAFSFMTFFDSKKTVFFADITYSFYKVYTNLLGLKCELIPLKDDFSIDVDGFLKENGGIIIPNPNAPTAKYIELNDIKRIIEYNFNSVVIVDEAYIDFGGESAVGLIKEYPNLLIVQTLSKSRSLAGLRVGFAMGDSKLIEGLLRVKNSINSYTLDRIALAGAEAAFKDKEYFQKTREKIIITRDRVTNELRKNGFKVIESKANFIFISHPKILAEHIFKELKKKGILVRYFNAERINNYLRVSIGNDEEMDKFVEKIKECVIE
ncbi:histidinol-phosphate transaminase [Clostridium felsineum]|uniref:Histidinol-phosphate aminotransferase n=1 Tax=Clostridium felsineum TaxID=36839 RepID=A0A1S8MH51_9CLOT|nr:histidinol-phosphate transaminase [Clostridium felsineum]URZ08088.1 Histidinol-phosphate aminotransferase [Clostridium felsineum]URZ13119.1 Histidinol-phosphate aminotransferase [Clostridium felsineum]